MSRSKDANDALSKISVASPCDEPWDNMEGDERVRHCERCALNVYNLSAMSKDEATDLVTEKEGELCVRYFRRSDGTVLTQDCPVGIAKKTFRWCKGIAASLLAALGFLSACQSDTVGEPKLQGKPTFSPEDGEFHRPTIGRMVPDRIMGKMIMGDVAAPEEDQETTKPTNIKKKDK